MCNITKCCTEVCPEHIKITDNAIIPMKERVVDTMYDPLVWLGNKIPRRSTVAANRALYSGDTVKAEAQARDRLRTKPSDRPALTTLQRSLHAQGRFAEAAEATRTKVEHAGRGGTARLDALGGHAWELLCAVEAGQLELDAVEDEISASIVACAAACEHRHRLSPAPTRCTSSCTAGWPRRSSTPARRSRWDQDRAARADDLITLSEALAALGESDEATRRDAPRPVRCGRTTRAWRGRARTWRT